jgi:hypothetical protein
MAEGEGTGRNNVFPIRPDVQTPPGGGPLLWKPALENASREWKQQSKDCGTPRT